jgi:hypothetical protein
MYIFFYLAWSWFLLDSNFYWKIATILLWKKENDSYWLLDICSLDKLKSKTTSTMVRIAIALKIASIKTSTSGLINLIKKTMIYLLNLINLRIVFTYKLNL